MTTNVNVNAVSVEKLSVASGKVVSVLQPDVGMVSNGMNNISRFITTMGSAGYANIDFSQSITWKHIKETIPSSISTHKDTFEDMLPAELAKSFATVKEKLTNLLSDTTVDVIKQSAIKTLRLGDMAASYGNKYTADNPQMNGLKGEFVANSSSELVHKYETTQSEFIKIIDESKVQELARLTIHGLGPQHIALLILWSSMFSLLWTTYRLSTPKFDIDEFINDMFKKHAKITRIHVYYDDGPYCLMPYVTQKDKIERVSYTPYQKYIAYSLAMVNDNNLPIRKMNKGIRFIQMSENILNQGARIAFVEQ
jgi:hypothetical protein